MKIIILTCQPKKSKKQNKEIAQNDCFEEKDSNAGFGIIFFSLSLVYQMNNVLDNYSKELERRKEGFRERNEARWDALKVPEKILRFNELVKEKLSQVSIGDLQQFFSTIYDLKQWYQSHNEDVFFRATERRLQDLGKFLKKYYSEDETL